MSRSLVWRNGGKETEFVLMKWHVSAVLGQLFFLSSTPD